MWVSFTIYTECWRHSGDIRGSRSHLIDPGQRYCHSRARRRREDVLDVKLETERPGQARRHLDTNGAPHSPSHSLFVDVPDCDGDDRDWDGLPWSRGRKKYRRTEYPGSPESNRWNSVRKGVLGNCQSRRLTVDIGTRLISRRDWDKEKGFILYVMKESPKYTSR